MAGGQVERVTQTDESWGVDPLLREVEVSDWQQRPTVTVAFNSREEGQIASHDPANCQVVCTRKRH